MLENLKYIIRAISASKNDALRDLLKKVLCEDIPLLALRVWTAKQNNYNLSFNDLYKDGINIPDNLLKLISIAQHYEYPTAMVDLSSSLDVGTWFATNSWTDGKPLKTGTGIIYRFDREAILKSIRNELSSPFLLNIRKMEASAIFGIADIKHLDPEFGLRPQRLHGASIFGLENTLIYLLLHYSFSTKSDGNDQISFEKSGFSAHTFPISLNIQDNIRLLKTDLAPECDPAIDVFSTAHLVNNSSIDKNEIRSFMLEENASNQEIKDVHRFMSMRLI